MTQSDTPRIGDIAAALRLLSRLPLPANPAAPRRAGAWAWPVAGALVAGLAVGAGLMALPLGPFVAGAVTLGVQAMLTGAMHEDGLADTVDGLWGGWDRARRLEIMKDSHIGTYGVMALIVVALIRWSALGTLLAGGQWGAILAVGALSRVPMAGLMALMRNARGTGLSQSVGRPPFQIAGLAALIGIGAVLPFGTAGLLASVAVFAVSVILGLTARAKIGGQTGDILGASQQLAEAAALSVLAGLLV